MEEINSWLEYNPSKAKSAAFLGDEGGVKEVDGGSRACELFDCGAQASRSGGERARCPRGPVVLNEEGWCSFGATSHGPEAKPESTDR
jgi:hypothetical protein